MNIIPKRAAFATGVWGYTDLVPQNGVADGRVLRCSSAVDAAMDPRNGSASAKRPLNLDVTSISGYAAKPPRSDSGGGDGSVPSSPEPQSDGEGEASRCPAADEALENDTRQLVAEFLRDYTGLSKAKCRDSKALPTMRRVVMDVLEKHRFAYNGMFNKLSLDDRGDDMTFVSAVAESLFSDGTTNWGRIASLMAFGAAVCQRMKEKGRDNCVELVGQEISTYLLSEQKDWLIKNNSWDGFVEFFRVSDSESTVRNALMAVAGVAGIGATLVLLIR